MRKFVNKYIDRFKDISNALSPQNMKAKSAGGFCDGKTEIGSHDLYQNSLIPLINILSDWDSGTLILNGTNISEFKDYSRSYSRLVAYYFSQIGPEQDVTEYYFKKLVDLEKVNSYPQLPVPIGFNEYPGWLDEIDANRRGTTRPACIELDPNLASATDIIIANSIDYADLQQQTYAQNLSSYAKPGFKNIYFSEGFAMSNDLVKLSPTSYPNLNIYDGITINLNTNEPYPRAGFQSWITSSSSYPDIHGNTQTTTPYTPNSYKDFLFRVKSTAENPSMQSNGQIEYNFRITYNGSTNEHRVTTDTFKTLFYGINVDMTPQEVYNHFQNNASHFGASGGAATNGIFPIAYSALYDPNLQVNHTTIPSNTQSMNNVVIGAVFVAHGFDFTDYHYTHSYPNNTLPSGNGWTIYEKITFLASPAMHGGGIENCEGCESGCWWDWKQEKIKCHSIQNSAFPFKSNDDCNLFKLRYPGYLCKPNSTPVIIDRDRDLTVATNSPATTTITNYDCTHPCHERPLKLGYPNALDPIDSANQYCGIKNFKFNYSNQKLSFYGCGYKVHYGFGTNHGSGTTTWSQSTVQGGAYPNTSGNGFLGFTTNNTHATFSVNPIIPGRFSVSMNCENTLGDSYWDVCLDWSGNTGYLKQVPCVNGKTPCCPTGINCEPGVPAIQPYPCEHNCMQKPVAMLHYQSGNPTGQTTPPTLFMECGVRDFSFDDSTQTLVCRLCSQWGHQTSISVNGGIVLQTAVATPPQPAYWSQTQQMSLVPIQAGRYTAKTFCANTVGDSYWDICLDYDANGDLEEVPCLNGKTPCCPTGINCNQNVLLEPAIMDDDYSLEIP